MIIDIVVKGSIIDWIKRDRGLGPINVNRKSGSRLYEVVCCLLCGADGAALATAGGAKNRKNAGVAGDRAVGAADNLINAPGQLTE